MTPPTIKCLVIKELGSTDNFRCFISSTTNKLYTKLIHRKLINKQNVNYGDDLICMGMNMPTDFLDFFREMLS